MYQFLYYLGAAFIVLLFWLWYKYRFHLEDVDIRLDLQPPKTWELFANGFASVLVKSEGKFPGGHEVLPSINISYFSCLNERKLQQYEEVCSFDGKTTTIIQTEVPICYPEVLALPSLGAIITSPSFPVKAIGLIHTKNLIVQYAPIPRVDYIHIQSRTSHFQVTDKGIEFYILTEVRKDDILIWSCMTTLLSRNAATRRRQRSRTPSINAHESNGGNPEKWERSIVCSVPANVGLKYAKVSGDYQPHHLYPLTAKIIGYPKPVAHGMWTLSCCLQHFTYVNELPNFPFQVDVSFKRPIFMPGELSFSYKHLVEGSRDRNVGHAFAVYDKEGKVPHLVGQIKPFDPIGASNGNYT